MNRLSALFARKHGDILNVYFTAGHPNLDDTVPVITLLARTGVDLIEVGIPYSDPLADGMTIQQSSDRALKNGMTLDFLFKQIAEARKTVDIPIILMGYFNQMLQYGPARFLEKCAAIGVDGLIIPDLPMNTYEKEYQAIFETYDIAISFLITPQTSEARIRQADQLSSGFIYVVSKSSITGSSGEISLAQQTYFSRIESMHLRSPQLIGFGIHDKTSYDMACEFANGAIIGSAFIRALEVEGSLEKKINRFIHAIR